MFTGLFYIDKIPIKYTADNYKCYNFKLNSLLEVSSHKYICPVFGEELA